MAFAFRTPFSTDHTKVGSSDSSNYPVPLIPTDNRFRTVANGGHVQNASGFDLRPYADTGHVTARDYELVLNTYNATTGTFEMWYREPTLSHTVDPLVQLFYGDATITTDGSSSAAWDANFAAVYHLGNGSTLSVADSTSNAVTGTNTNGVTAAAGLVGGGAGSFASASTQYIALGTTINPAAVTYEALLKATSFPSAYNAVVSRSNGAAVFSQIFVKSNGTIAFYLEAVGGALDYDGTGSHTLVTGTTYYLAGGYDSTTGMTGYVNGASDGTAAANGAIVSTAVATRIGSDPGVGSREWNGQLDEVRISSVKRGADWITATANALASPTTFAVIGTEVSVGAATHLALAVQPFGAVSGIPLTTQPSGTVQDASNATVTSDTSTITATLNVTSGSGAFTGTTTAVASAGAWAFSNLGITPGAVGTGTITFSDGALTTVTSSPFSWAPPASLPAIPVFGFPIFSDPGVLFTPAYSGGSWAAALPIANVADRRLGLIARSTDATTGSTTFDIDLGTPRAIGLLAILIPNLTKSSVPTVQWKGSTVSNFATLVYDSGAVQAWPSGVTAEDVGPLHVWTPTLPVTPQTARYWRCSIVDTANADGHVDVARVIVAAGYQPTVNAATGAKAAIETDATRTFTDGGAAVYQERPTRRSDTFTVNKIAQPETFANIRLMQRILGISGQLFFVFDPTDTALMYERAYLCVFKQLDPIDLPAFSLRTIPFAFVEEL